jgi:hypothetical protein
MPTHRGRLAMVAIEESISLLPIDAVLPSQVWHELSYDEVTNRIRFESIRRSTL